MLIFCSLRNPSIEKRKSPDDSYAAASGTRSPRQSKRTRGSAQTSLEKMESIGCCCTGLGGRRALYTKGRDWDTDGREHRLHDSRGLNYATEKMEKLLKHQAKKCNHATQVGSARSDTYIDIITEAQY